MTLAMGGDGEAKRRLVERYQPRLLRTARRMLGDAELAAASVQEAWISILRGLPGLREPSRFPAFAFGILRRRCVDAIRKAQRGRQVFADGLSGEDIAEGATPARQGEALSIRQAFATLPDDQRLAAQLFFVEGLSLAEIAKVQKVPVGTAKSRLFYARKRLKTALDETKTEGDTL